MRKHTLLALCGVLGIALVGCKGEETDDPNAENCSNDADDDGDGAIDCDDNECFTDAACDVEDTDNTDTDTDEPPVEPGGDIATALAITADENGIFVHEDEIGSAGDRDFYQIQATAGEAIVVHILGGGEEADPDSVVRIYDGSGALIAENDDLPYRILGTDSGMIFRAEATGPYYVEVLEWSDWDPTSDGPVGGANFSYVMAAYPYPADEPPNDTIADGVAALDTYEDEDTTNNAGIYYGDPWTFDYPDSLDLNAYLFTVGTLSSGDEDYIGFRFPIEGTDGTLYDYGFIEFSIFPGIDTPLDAVFEIVNEDDEVIARVQPGDTAYFDPTNFPGGGENVGLMAIVHEGGDYFLRISDNSGSADSWYAAIGNYSAFNEDVVFMNTVSTSSETDEMAGAQTTALTADTGVSYAFVNGFLDTSDDMFDSFEIEDGVEAGQLLTVSIGTQAVGSELDARIRILDETGNEIAEAADAGTDSTLPDDPLLLDFELPDDVGSKIYVVIEREDGSTSTGPLSYFHGFVQIEDPS